MTTIITRSALVFHGHNPAPEVASICIDHKGRHVVTWADVLRERRERQARRLEQLRYVQPWRAARVLVAYFGQDLMGGWHAFLEDWRGRTSWRSIWVDRDGKGYVPDLMRLFPLCGLFADWTAWKIAFAKTYQRRRQHRKPVGVAALWWRDHEIRLPEPKANVPLTLRPCTWLARGAVRIAQ